MLDAAATKERKKNKKLNFGLRKCQAFFWSDFFFLGHLDSYVYFRSFFVTLGSDTGKKFSLLQVQFLSQVKLL